MRLVRRGTTLVPHFTLVWEVPYLAEQGACWVPFARVRETEPIGEIHASTHEVRLYEGIVVIERQAVALCAGKWR